MCVESDKAFAVPSRSRWRRRCHVAVVQATTQSTTSITPAPPVP